MYKKQTNTKIKKTFLILHYSTLKSTVGQYSSWQAGSGIKCTGKKSSWIEEQEEMGDGRVPLSSIQLCCLDAKLHLTLATPWTVAHQAPLSMGFSTQEYCSELPFLLQGIFPDQGSNSCLLHSQVDSLLRGHQGSLFYAVLRVQYTKALPLSEDACT